MKNVKIYKLVNKIWLNRSDVDISPIVKLKVNKKVTILLTENCKSGKYKRVVNFC